MDKENTTMKNDTSTPRGGGDNTSQVISIPQDHHSAGISERTWNIFQKILDAPSLYPERQRKPREQRFDDLMRWLKKYRYINGSYNEYGMDIVGFENEDEYVEHYTGHLEAFKTYQFYRMKNSIIPRPLNAVLSDDKFVFSSYMESVCPGIVPKTFLYVHQGGKVAVKPGIFTDALAAIKELPDGKYVCKPTLGQCGRNIIIITVKHHHFTLNNGLTVDDIKKGFEKEPYIIQEFLVQHKLMEKLNPSSVNTLRIITTKFNHSSHLFTAMVRAGTTDSLVDNAAAGGTFIGIDFDSGKLQKYGCYHDKPRETRHPVSGISYEGYQIPFWKESLELVKYLHIF